jgi:hypothetical protein
MDTSAGQFAQNLVHHGEGELAVNPSNGLIRLENVLSDCNINRQAEKSVSPKISWTTTSFMGKTSHSFNHRFKYNHIKYRETGINSQTFKYKSSSPAPILLNTADVTFRGTNPFNSFLCAYVFICTHDNPNSFNFVRDMPHSCVIIQYVYISTAYDHQTPIIWSARKTKIFITSHLWLISA